MADAAKVDVEAPEGGRKRGAGGLLVGLAAMLALGGGGFYATWSGLLTLPLGGAASDSAGADRGTPGEALPDAAAFVETPQIVVSVGPGAAGRHLRLKAALDVTPGSEAAVEALMPRILDVMNTYLQALEEADVERPAAMTRIRAHLLRRMQVVVGREAVRDLLITEFVLQ
jgi:flagellar FliL protein